MGLDAGSDEDVGGAREELDSVSTRGDQQPAEDVVQANRRAATIEEG